MRFASFGFNPAGILCEYSMHSTRCVGLCCFWVGTKAGMTDSTKPLYRMPSTYGANIWPVCRKRRSENEDEAVA